MLALTIYAAVVGTISLGFIVWKYFSVYFKKVTVSASVGGVWGSDFDDPMVSVECENRTKKNFILTNIGIAAKGKSSGLGDEKQKKKSDVWYITGKIDVYPDYPGGNGPEKIPLPTTIHPTKSLRAYMPVDTLLNYLMDYGEVARVRLFIEDDSKNRHKCRPMKVNVHLWGKLLGKEFYSSVD